MPDDDPRDPYLDRVVAGTYRVEARLGVGSVGTVYRASHVTLERAVALKILRATLATDPEFVARFTREARLAARIDHPNVVRMYDSGTDADGLTYLAMELLAGDELAHVMATASPLPPERIVRLLAQVLAALGSAHRLGIVHRDLKPENILVLPHVDDDGRPDEIVKVADFGIARVYGESASASEAITRFGAVSGTPEYMSPEQASGDELDGRADVYACGVILYEMLAGRVPFTGDSAMETLEKHLRAELPPPSRWRADIDPRLESIAVRALAKDRAARFDDAGSMRAALLEALSSPRPAHGVASAVQADRPASTAEPSAPSVLIESGPSVMIESASPSVLIESGPSVMIESAPPSVLIESGPSVMIEGAPKATVATPTPESSRRGRAAGWVSAVALLIVVGAAGAYWMYGRRSTSGVAPPETRAENVPPGPLARDAGETTTTSRPTTPSNRVVRRTAAPRPAPAPAGRTAAPTRGSSPAPARRAHR